MIRHPLAAVLLLCCMAAPLQATEADYEKAMAHGLEGIESGDYAAAAAEFRRALAEHPDDLRATLYLGIAQSRSRHPEAEETLKVALRRDPSDVRANLELGNLYLQRGIYDEAQDYFQQTLTLGAEGEIADAARRGLEAAAGRKGVQRWGIRLQAGGQYDDNVILNANGSPLPQGIRRKGDWRGIASLGLTAVPFKSERFEVTAGYDVYQSVHSQLYDYNLTRNQADLAVAWRPVASVTAGLAYAFEHLIVGGSDFSYGSTVTPSLTYTPREGLSSQLSYRYRGLYYHSHPLFGANHDRSGDSHQAGFIQKVPLSDAVVVRAGYYFERDLTERSYWDASGSRLLAGVTARLPLELVGDLSGEGTLRRYGGVYPGTTATRQDTGWSVSLVLSRAFGPNVSLAAGYYYTDNDSNLSGFRYSRSITSLLGQVRF